MANFLLDSMQDFSIAPACWICGNAPCSNSCSGSPCNSQPCGSGSNSNLNSGK